MSKNFQTSKLIKPVLVRGKTKFATLSVLFGLSHTISHHQILENKLGEFVICNHIDKIRDDANKSSIDNLLIGNMFVRKFRQWMNTVSASYKDNSCYFEIELCNSSCRSELAPSRQFWHYIIEDMTEYICPVNLQPIIEDNFNMDKMLFSINATDNWRISSTDLSDYE